MCAKLCVCVLHTMLTRVCEGRMPNTEREISILSNNSGFLLLLTKRKLILTDKQVAFLLMERGALGNECSPTVAKTQ